MTELGYVRDSKSRGFTALWVRLPPAAPEHIFDIKSGNCYYIIMSKTYSTKYKNGRQLPLFIEKDEDGFYVVECPIFEGCYSQGKTVDEALKNIREVIELIMEEKVNRELLQNYHPKEMSLHTITL